MRGELRNWVEIHLNDASYFNGRLYGDAEKRRPDGSDFRTGFVLVRIDRGDYILVRTLGNMVYILYKDRKGS